jgi:hypothetical protein
LVNIPAGSSGASLSVDIYGDSLDRSDESIHISWDTYQRHRWFSMCTHQSSDDDPPMVTDIPSQQQMKTRIWSFSSFEHLSGQDVIVPFSDWRTAGWC